jgi:hypothetical protein
MDYALPPVHHDDAPAELLGHGAENIHATYAYVCAADAQAVLHAQNEVLQIERLQQDFRACGQQRQARLALVDGREDKYLAVAKQRVRAYVGTDFKHPLHPACTVKDDQVGPGPVHGIDYIVNPSHDHQLNTHFAKHVFEQGNGHPVGLRNEQSRVIV